MVIRNLAGVFTGEGFVKKDGRKPTFADCDFVAGPIDIAIENGLIRGIGRNLHTGGDVINATGMVAIPGFVDPHTHAIFSGDRSSEYFMRWAGKTYLEISDAGGGIHSTVAATRAATDDSLRDALRSRLSAMLRTGTTTVEVKSGYANCAADELRLLRLTRSVSDSRLPEVRASFLGLHALPKGRNEAEYVDEMLGTLQVVRNERLADHVDSFPEKGFFSLDGALRFSKEAAELGIPCKVHADELCDLGSSASFIRAGALSIDHLQYISDEAVSMLATQSTVATMLPATSFFVGIPYANARRLLDAGARVALATDFNPGTAPAMDLQLTHMLAASQMKMSAAEILCASTFNAAAALGLEKSHGTIASRRVADVLLYPAQNSDGSGELERIIIGRQIPQTVFHRGVVI